MKPKILFTSAILAHPPIGGPELRIENSIKALAQVSDLYLYCRKTESKIGGPQATRYLAHYCKEIRFINKVSWEFRIRSKIIKLLSRMFRRSATQQWIDHPDAMADLLRTVRDINPDLIWIGYGNTSYPLLRYLKQNIATPVVADTDSVWSRFLSRELPYIEDALKSDRLRKEVADKELEERKIVSLADVTTAVSSVDEEYYKQYAGNRSCVMRFSNVIDLESYAPPPPAADMAHPSVCVTGSFFAPNCPMEHATRWFISKVLPLVQVSYPNVKIFILGKGSDTLVGDLAGPNVICKGFVPSVLPYLCHMDVVAVPLWFESGTRFKILEAGACRRAVVSTTLGAEGLPTNNYEHLLIADTPADFASAICRLISDSALSVRLADRLHGLVNASNGIPSLAAEAQMILRAVLKG